MNNPADIDIWPDPPIAKPPAVPAPPPVQREDEGIFCPLCNYNLTGIHSGRCPECGAWFNRAALIAAQQAHRITLIPWDDPEDMRLRDRLLATLRICLLRAERFAFAFSVQPQRTRALTFFTIMVGLAIVAAWINVAAFFVGFELLAKDPALRPEVAPNLVAMALFVPLAMVVNTVLIGAILGGACPHYDGKLHFKPWLSISAYAAAHYILLAGAFPCSFILSYLVDRPSFFEFIFILVILWIGCSMLCLLTLQAVLNHRTASNAARGGAAAIIWIAHFISPIVCAGIAFAIAEAVFDYVALIGW